MVPKLYTSLASWWHLLSDPKDYAEEAGYFWRLMAERAHRPVETLLELGSGGGNNASHLKHHCRMTLSDLSPQMLDASRAINPECKHVPGDMRTLRLGRTFDAVFVHDAMMYMTTEDDLRRAMATAFAHCAPGGVALFVTDCTRETWTPSTSHGGHDAANRSMRYLQWDWDPDPTDTEYLVDMVYALRENDGPPRIEQDRHRLGVFPRATWLRLLDQVGFHSGAEPCRYAGGEHGSVFFGVRAA